MPFPADPTTGGLLQKVMYGYIRMEEPDEIEIALLRKQMAVVAAAHGCWLGAVFIDRQVPADTVARMGFTALVDVLSFPDTFGVVVPTLDDLSTESGLRNVLKDRITSAACKLFVISGNGVSA
ncbi:hypothetical protein Lesp02_29920 [Lentzea sp. NBRC 105346]|uniref:hypothetical protein n=1 Tax=Lentzea sp. NBRC 105346 TaxID=3032205 RepID=UPI0024A5E072|nr:hypothetical protein [Lentzea sp. NBRC 105346]GLZ30803.1 hypothetical protein Lesp02_29920 [Lentzea sp. NBRC 105346]